MGGCCDSKMNVQEPRHYSSSSGPAPKVFGVSSNEAQQDWGASGGKRLGTGSDDGASGAVASQAELRRRALEAAERRQVSAPGISEGKAAGMLERRQKEELLGKITEHYQKHGGTRPMGLNLAGVPQLKK